MTHTHTHTHTKSLFKPKNCDLTVSTEAEDWESYPLVCVRECVCLSECVCICE